MGERIEKLAQGGIVRPEPGWLVVGGQGCTVYTTAAMQPAPHAAPVPPAQRHAEPAQRP